MARNDYSEKVDIPEGVTVTVTDNVVSAKGPKGEVSKKLEAPGTEIKVEEGAVALVAKDANKVQKNLLFTFKAHVKNLLIGANEGYSYKLKICSGHFPMTVAVKGNTVEIKNFIGEKVPRVLTLKEGAEVKINGDDIEVTSVNKEIAGQVAADIEKMTRRPGFDRRIFQDGIYITEKAGKAV